MPRKISQIDVLRTVLTPMRIKPNHPYHHFDTTTPYYTLQEGHCKDLYLWGTGQRGIASFIPGTKADFLPGQLERFFVNDHPENLCGECDKVPLTPAEIRDIVCAQSSEWQIVGLKVDYETGTIYIVIDKINPDPIEDDSFSLYSRPLIPITEKVCSFLLDFGECVIHVANTDLDTLTWLQLDVIISGHHDCQIRRFSCTESKKFATPWLFLDYTAP